MPDRMTDSYIRRAAFDWLSQQLALHGDVLPRNVLAQGFDFRGERVPLLGPQGIFKPRIMGVPLSITTIPSGPYEDGFSTDGLLRYRYRGTNPEHVDNRGLRHAMLHRIPLVYFFRIVKAKYLAVWPVFIVGDNPETLTFMVEVDDAQYMSPGFGQQVLNTVSRMTRRQHGAPTSRLRFGSACTSVHSGSEYCVPTKSNAPCAGCATKSSWMPPTSFPIPPRARTVGTQRPRPLQASPRRL